MSSIAMPLTPSPVALAQDRTSAETLAIIAAVVHVTFGAAARVADVVPLRPVASVIDTSMQYWSMEGRRQIYSSHQIR